MHNRMEAVAADSSSDVCRLLPVEERNLSPVQPFLPQPERDNNQPSKGVNMMTEHAFLSDVKTLRERARKHLEQGALGSTYVGDVKKTIELLQAVLATEIVCVLRYTQNSIAA